MTILECLLLVALTTNAVIVLWFQTDAVTEYARALRLGRLIGLGHWEEWRKGKLEEPIDKKCATCEAKRRAAVSWLKWVAVRSVAKGPGWRFLGKLVTCPLCLGLWVAMATSFALERPSCGLPGYFVAAVINQLLDRRGVR